MFFKILARSLILFAILFIAFVTLINQQRVQESSLLVQPIGEQILSGKF